MKVPVVPPQETEALMVVYLVGPFFHLIWSCLSAMLNLAKMFQIPSGFPLLVLPETMFP